MRSVIYKYYVTEAAIVEKNYEDMDSLAVKKFLIRGAIKDSNRIYPNREWGYGKLNIYSVFDTLR